MNRAAERREWKPFVTLASEPYRRADRFAWFFARGKLNMDPVFRHLLGQGLIAPHSRVLDIGCGQGLLASLLSSATSLAEAGRWPLGWPSAPVDVRFTGIEMMPLDVQRARAALGDTAQFVCGDMRRTSFPAVDAVVILDVLHYVTRPEQDDLLLRVREALHQGGRLLLRVGDAAARRGFLASQWVDAVVTFVRGHRVLPQYGRTLAQWVAQLQSLGFEVQSQPMSQGTPFANVLLVARVPGAAQVQP